MTYSYRRCHICDVHFRPRYPSAVHCPSCRRLGLHKRETYRKWLPGALRERQRGVCEMCGDPLPEERDQVEIDHIHPQHLGGDDSLQNLRLVHVECNQARNAAPGDYEKYGQRELGARFLKARRHYREKEQRRRAEKKGG